MRKSQTAFLRFGKVRCAGGGEGVELWEANFMPKLVYINKFSQNQKRFSVCMTVADTLRYSLPWYPLKPLALGTIHSLGHVPNAAQHSGAVPLNPSKTN